MKKNTIYVGGLVLVIILLVSFFLLEKKELVFNDGRINGISIGFTEVFSIKEEKFYLYDVTLQDSKETVIEKLGNDFIEEINLEIGGVSSYDRLIYESLDLTILFIENKIVSIMVKINDEKEFNNYYDSFTGNKLYHEVSEDFTSEDNTRILYSEESMHIAVIKYDPNKILWFTIGKASPETIDNYKKGILE